MMLQPCGHPLKAIQVLIGWTAWPILPNHENRSKERCQKVGENVKIAFYKKNRKRLGERSRMYFAVLDGFRLILMIFIDQNMRFHGFSMLSVKNPRILSQILFKTKDFCVNSIFFENFLHNDPKFVFFYEKYHFQDK